MSWNVIKDPISSNLNKFEKNKPTGKQWHDDSANLIEPAIRAFRLEAQYSSSM